jgi:sugar phosphate isomerase/epimerase
MTTRRSFLGTVAGGMGAAMAWPGRARAAGAGKPPLGLQLWSVRDGLEKDLPGTLRQVRAWGFEEVESAGTYGRTAGQFRAALDGAGLRCRSMHVDWDRMQADFAGVLKDAEEVGAGTIVNPSLPHGKGRYCSREEILRAAGAFAGWSREARAVGRRFAYHVHGHEFGPAPEGTLFDVLAREAGPDVGFEADVFWITWGGADPVALMKKHPGRVWYKHLKDMARGTKLGEEVSDEANVVLGTGTIDIAGIVAAGAEAGVEIHYLEDESADPFGHIPKSRAYYESLGG